MRRASALRWPWLANGSVPPEDSIRMSDQITPVLIWTEAIFCTLMLISSRLNQERLRRITAFSLTSMTVGKRKLPFVHRLAWNASIVLLRSMNFLHRAGKLIVHAASMRQVQASSSQGALFEIRAFGLYDF